ncbi:MAG: hypothetical protein QXZ09_06260 [Candidatus Methanomethylicaceae archaeon]
MNREIFILGAGMTGLAAGMVSGLPVYEAEESPGGICSSYYIRPGDSNRLHTAPKDEEAYRFEIGGGHWIFGGDPLVLRFIRSIASVKSYIRRSAVYLPDLNLFVPYPIQNHLRYLGQELAAKALREIVAATLSNRPVETMADWLQSNFGTTLCELFFFPFHELYTAGLYRHIAPQDSYKSPIDLSLVIQGAFNEVPLVGYNATFVYPVEGLNTLVQRMAERCNAHYEKKAVSIDVKEKVVYFEDGSTVRYEILLSTLPLNRMIEITGLTIDEEPNPSTSVLVVNIGALKGPLCPDYHWVYVPRSKAGFHRVGFYSNVDVSFLPASARGSNDRVSIYVEKAYPEGQRPSEAEVKALVAEIIKELQAWGWIEEVEVVDPTWIDVAYTWSWPGSRWTEKALKALEKHDIYQIGRFARWLFQGIADSIRDGLIAGASFKG